MTTAGTKTPPVPLKRPTPLPQEKARELSVGMNVILADVFALYLKTKNFHWHVSGPHFPHYHAMFDDQADQIFATTDAIAERVRKIGGITLRSIGEISRLQRVKDNESGYVSPANMLA